MRHAAARDGVSLRIVSGFRSMKEQQVLHACHKKGKCPLAARPGYSHHQDGLALDLNAKDRGVYDWLERNATAFGFRRTVPSEPWHWERYEGVINVQSLCQS
jgi:LAS superfamily LD-carboxypeptidase LdcB